MGEIEKAARREPTGTPSPSWEEIVDPVERMDNQTPPPAPPPAHLDEH